MRKMRRSDVYEIITLRWGDKSGYFIMDSNLIVTNNTLVCVDLVEPNDPTTINSAHQFFGFCPDDHHVCVSSLSFYCQDADELMLKNLVDEIGVKLALEFMDL